MPQTDSTKDSVPLSVEKIIDLIRTVRNDLIKHSLRDDFLDSIYQEKFKKPLSSIKREFLKRELKELLIAPVDLVHYAGVINHIKETGETSLASKDSVLFMREIDQLFDRYSM